ncbi:unnamed protein product [Cylindrotheca closterium]|uniref:RNA-editing substrate-binding complex 6 protein domain-containing protein n=1 Tax=Cylindrotheca closterium TaxID=2856 RepID=A0AAD2G6K3_9STRA|nr:unnamed protein product [Cylindrotheca closterium]
MVRTVLRTSMHRYVGRKTTLAEWNKSVILLKSTTSLNQKKQSMFGRQICCKSLLIQLPQQQFRDSAFFLHGYSTLRHFSQSTHGARRSNTSHISQQLQACQNARDLSMFLRTNGRLFHGRQEFELLEQRIKVLNKTTRMTAAHVAGLMNAVSRISTVAKSQQRQALMDLSRVAQPMLRHCQVKELCNILNSLASKDVQNHKLFHQASKFLMSSNYSMAMNPQDMAILANAFARVQHQSSKLFEAIAVQAIPQIQDFTPQGLSNLVNAFSKQDHPDSKLFEAVADETERRLTMLRRQQEDDDDVDDSLVFSPQGLANIANAFAKMHHHHHPKLFAAISKAAIPCIDEFTPQNLSNMANAFAKMSDQHHDEEELLLLFDAISKAALDKVPYFNAQELANLANAMVKMMGHHHGATTALPLLLLLQEIARAAIPLLSLLSTNNSSFNAQELAMLLNALTKNNKQTPTVNELLPGETQDEFWKASATATLSLLPEFQLQELCIVANAFSKAPPQPLSNGGESPYDKMKLFDRIAEAALDLLSLLVGDEKNHQFQPQNLSILANAFAKVNHHEATDMFQALIQAAIPLLPQMSPQEVANLVSAVAKQRIEGPMADQLFAETAKLLLLQSNDRIASWEQRNLVEVAYAFLKAFQTNDILLERIGSEIYSRPELELDAMGLGHLAAVLSRTPIGCSAELLHSIFASFERMIPQDSIQISNVADICKAIPLAYELKSISKNHGFLRQMVEYSIRKRHNASPPDVRDLLLNLTSPRLSDHGDTADNSSLVELQRSLLVAYQPILEQCADHQIAAKHVKTIRRAYKRLHV